MPQTSGVSGMLIRFTSSENDRLPINAKDTSRFGCTALFLLTDCLNTLYFCLKITVLEHQKSTRQKLR